MTDHTKIEDHIATLAWKNAYDPNDGTDCVTPFDTYLLKSPAEAQPVAWDVFDKEGNLIAGRVSKADADEIASRWEYEGSRISPLYTAPQQAGVPEGAIEVLRDPLSPDGSAVSIVFTSQERADRFRDQLNEAMQVQQNLAAPPRREVSDGGPIWSRTKPTRPGVYGVRGFNLGREPEDQFEAIVSVRLVDGELLCNLHESTSEDDFERWSRVVEDNSDSFEWCEFVPATAPQQASAPVGVEGDTVRTVVADMRKQAAEMEGSGGCEGAWAHHQRNFANRLEALAQQLAPVAPVGVEGWRVEPVEDDPDMLAVETPDGRTWFAKRGDLVFELAEALALTQQPAAVDPEDIHVESYPEQHGGFRVGSPRGIKITHKSGLIVASTKERSAHANRDAAMRALAHALAGQQQGGPQE